MPIFTIKNNKASKITVTNFPSEKDLQKFVENNLEELFGITFLASEYSTNNGGRIDTIGIDENKSPVIIEYKWGENNAIINQGLFYLDWLVEHYADIQLLIQKKIGKDIEVEKGSPRVLLIASSYSKYDKFAINRMAENIEMWSYNNYENLFELKLVASSQAKNKNNEDHKVTKISYNSYTTNELLSGKSEIIKELFSELQEKILSFDDAGEIEELTRKLYVAYRTNRNFVYINFRADKILIDVAMTIDKVTSLSKEKIRDMRGIGHHGAGYTRYELSTFAQLDEAISLIKESYDYNN